ADQPGQRHASKRRRRGAAGSRRFGARLEILLELGEARLDRLEFLARALEHGALHVELLACDEIHAFQPGLQQRLEIALEVSAEGTKILRQRLRELAGKIVQIE